MYFMCILCAYVIDHLQTLVTEDAALPDSDNVKTFTSQVVLGTDDVS